MTFRLALAMPADSSGAYHVDLTMNGVGGQSFCCCAMLSHFVIQWGVCVDVGLL